MAWIGRAAPSQGRLREQRRLRTLFASVVAAAAAPGVVLAACADAPSPAATQEATDATTGEATAAASGDAGSETGAEAPADAPGADCWSVHVLGCAPLLYVDAAHAQADVEVCPLELPCGLPTNTLLSGCQLDDLDGAPFGCTILEEAGCADGSYQETACGEVLMECRCDLFVGGGRGSSGVRTRVGAHARGPAGAYLARMAMEEAASVLAFRRLRRELAALHAPRALLHATARAEADEVRHARAFARLATRANGRAPRVAAGSRSPRCRSLEAVARENAIEGCVRETYGALLATWQARRAGSPAMRRLLARVAADETRHAALAWAVASWAEDCLDADARRRVSRARARAAHRLARRLERPVPAELGRVAGMPSPDEARALLSGIASRLSPAAPRRRQPPPSPASTTLPESGAAPASQPSSIHAATVARSA